MAVGFIINRKLKMGWLPDHPDFRDYTNEHKTIESMLKKTKAAGPAKASLPASVDFSVARAHRYSSQNARDFSDWRRSVHRTKVGDQTRLCA